MIFGPLLFPLVMTDRKRMTRRKVRPDEILCRYRPGRDYAVQPGRGKPSAGRILIDSVHRERLGDINEWDARWEGFADRASFLAYWRKIYDEAVDPFEQVWVIKFTIAAPCRGGCGEMTYMRANRDGERIPLCGKVECSRTAL